jgi:hypothetical protein
LAQEAEERRCTRSRLIQKHDRISAARPLRGGLSFCTDFVAAHESLHGPIASFRCDAIGRESADGWLKSNFDHLGVETTIDLHSRYF